MIVKEVIMFDVDCPIHYTLLWLKQTYTYHISFIYKIWFWIPLQDFPQSFQPVNQLFQRRGTCLSHPNLLVSNLAASFPSALGPTWPSSMAWTNSGSSGSALKYRRLCLLADFARPESWPKISRDLWKGEVSKPLWRLSERAVPPCQICIASGK